MVSVRGAFSLNLRLLPARSWASKDTYVPHPAGRQWALAPDLSENGGYDYDHLILGTSRNDRCLYIHSSLLALCRDGKPYDCRCAKSHLMSNSRVPSLLTGRQANHLETLVHCLLHAWKPRDPRAVGRAHKISKPLYIQDRTPLSSDAFPFCATVGQWHAQCFSRYCHLRLEGAVTKNFDFALSMNVPGSPATQNPHAAISCYFYSRCRVLLG